MPQVSVLLPVYNALPYLRETVDSLLRQTFADFEILALDDASTDGSREFLASVTDPRLRLFPLLKAGLAANLNVGLREARGEFSARMDADDVCETDRLRAQVDFLRSHPDVVICGCQAAMIDRQGAFVGHMRYDTQDVLIRYRLLAQSAFPHPGVTYRTDAVRAAGGYGADLVPVEDYDLWLRLAQRGRLANLPESLLRYRVHQTSVSVVQSPRQREMTRRLSAQALLDSRLAATARDTEAFQNCFAQKASDETYPWFAAFLRVVDRFCRRAVLRDPESVETVQALRAGLGYNCLQAARRAGWLSEQGIGWLRLAQQADPQGTSPANLARRLYRRLRKQCDQTNSADVGRT